MDATPQAEQGRGDPVLVAPPGNDKRAEHQLAVMPIHLASSLSPCELKVLLVEDDEDDYILTRGLLSEIKGWRFALEWINNPGAGLEAMTQNRHDVCLVDYRLGAQNGIELLRAALERGCEAPII